MWISSDRFWKMVEALAVANERTRMAEAKLSAMQATQDWLTSHVNRLEHERGLLTQARLGLTFPVPLIEREEPHAPGVDPGAIRGVPEDSIPLAQMMAATMEDVGDDQARALGIKHDEMGNVEYTR